MSSGRSHPWELPRPPVGWELGETLPTSLLHQAIVTLLHALLAQWTSRFHPEMLVARDLGARIAELEAELAAAKRSGVE